MIKGWKPEYDILATYNSEVWRGIVHTEKWKEKMEKLQKEYNEKIVNSLR